MSRNALNCVNHKKKKLTKKHRQHFFGGQICRGKFLFFGLKCLKTPSNVKISKQDFSYKMAAILDFVGPIFELVRDFGVTNTCTKFEENMQTPAKVRALTRRARWAGGGGARDSIISPFGDIIRLLVVNIGLRITCVRLQEHKGGQFQNSEYSSCKHQLRNVATVRAHTHMHECTHTPTYLNCTEVSIVCIATSGCRWWDGVPCLDQYIEILATGVCVHPDSVSKFTRQ